jgi:hypothetical protein
MLIPSQIQISCLPWRANSMVVPCSLAILRICLMRLCFFTVDVYSTLDKKIKGSLDNVGRSTGLGQDDLSTVWRLAMEFLVPTTRIRWSVTQREFDAMVLLPRLAKSTGGVVSEQSG